MTTGDLRVSVALCTYQGAAFLPEQLASIAGQSRVPDELVACDDGSTDGTVELLEDFARSAPFPVDVHVNPIRLGATRNFAAALDRCRGDIVVLCDQDDVWLPNRIEVVARLFAGDQELGGVFSDADLIGGATKATLWEAVGFDERRRVRYQSGPSRRVEMLSGMDLVSGATLAVRASLRDLILPIPEDWCHDAWIAFLVAAVSELRPVPQPLIRYRVHPGQAIGLPVHPTGPVTRASRRARHDTLRRQLDRCRQAHDRLVQKADAFPVAAASLARMDSILRHYQARADIFERGGRWLLVSRELVTGRYHRYSKGLRSALRDALVVSS